MSIHLGDIDIYTVFVLYFFERKNWKTKIDWGEKQKQFYCRSKTFWLELRVA